MIAGVLYILAMLIGLWQFMGVLSAYQLIQTANGITQGLDLGMWSMFSGIIMIFLILTLLGVIGCLLAAIFCFMRKKFALAVIGGVLGFVGLHFLFGLIGFILMMGSKKEFT